MAEEKVDKPLGRLILRHASRRTSGTWGPDDYDVIDSNGRDVGRIFKPRAGAPPDYLWMWTIPRFRSECFCRANA
jgi:hypothetical protein